LATAIAVVLAFGAGYAVGGADEDDDVVASGDVDQLTAERDELASERDELESERDDLQARLDEALASETERDGEESQTDAESAEEESEAEEAVAGEADGSRQNPFTIGTPVGNDEWEVTLGEPREAWDEILAENQFNDPPEDGMEFYIVPVAATYVGDESGNAAWAITVKFVGEDNRTYSDWCGALPDSLYDFDDVYTEGTVEGNFCVVVPEGASGLWTLAVNYSDPVFFVTE
jgi:seryl-tRNA synthetase